jgi:hypothetical protein
MKFVALIKQIQGQMWIKVPDLLVTELRKTGTKAVVIHTVPVKKNTPKA